MFKKRLNKKKTGIEIIEKEPTTGGPESVEPVVDDPKPVFFKKRDIKAASNRLNRVSTAIQDTTSKQFMNREVQDLTNSYKCSAEAKKLQM
mmetsp:Transcript_12868/g.17312  ORF Transcript_12868/g.17312 Transcript_12868/m.17312 type:complete len:91 (+) Transcript_12868:3-275(+)